MKKQKTIKIERNVIQENMYKEKKSYIKFQIEKV